MNTNVYENTDSETITPLNKRRILPVFLLVGLYAASTAAVMSVLPFYIREMGAFFHGKQSNDIENYLSRFAIGIKDEY
ncbi:hypothetical protein A9Y87_12120 [Salmonella enterica subsp. enterica]|nr:hypothetical protein A9Y87_12120 [Salmonella enterica subsp. enterica]